jgi:hypothetical protein
VFNHFIDNSDLLAEWIFSRLVKKTEAAATILERNPSVSRVAVSTFGEYMKNKGMTITVMIKGDHPIICTVKLFHQLHQPKWKIEAVCDTRRGDIRTPISFILDKSTRCTLHNSEII